MRRARSKWGELVLSGLIGTVCLKFTSLTQRTGADLAGQWFLFSHEVLILDMMSIFQSWGHAIQVHSGSDVFCHLELLKSQNFLVGSAPTSGGALLKKVTPIVSNKRNKFKQSLSRLNF